jgi:hypothetical protein
VLWLFTPFGEIPWRRLSRFDDREMKILMVDVVQTAHQFIQELFDEGAPRRRRSPRMTHLCSAKLTHTKNRIWRTASVWAALSSTPKACKPLIP